jgi:hypothetical protein
MCIVCLEFQKNSLTIIEARTALKEVIMFADSEEAKQHAEELSRMSDEEFRKATKVAAGEQD